MTLRSIKVLFFFAFALVLVNITYSNAGESYKIINTNSLVKLIEAKKSKVLVIDARNPEEYQDVHIKNSINIPEKKFSEYTDLLPKDKKAIIVFYCNGVKCGKSKRAAKKAAALKYSNIYVYAEGMPVWEEFDLPKVTGPNYEVKIETNRLSPLKLKKMAAKNSANITIVDVRDKSEYDEGHIPGSVNIPVKIFALRSGELDKKKTIVVYCNAGNRSYKAYRKLMKLSYKKIYQTLLADWRSAGLKVEK